ncbi:transglutaminase-like domain-containing protein [Poseidonocella sedimentorum]|uniref:Transglutaminase-like enzyme, putative cysteine protease n=1 Tax=Poseidonocella sedimentorum TaxID=871652 RepID=A0A1I6D819_9RHOB|nr:transglutaminase family protein [Poseidonocella sedimentorum]SFR01558.1 Transglutaminase-like enzyme, putative cysteine protease [Poseidonocella sedimentorum]
MKLQIGVELHYAVESATDIILQIEVPSFADQRVVHEKIELSETLDSAQVSAEEGLGHRRLLQVDKDFKCSYVTHVEVDRPALDISQLPAVPPHQLPSDAIRYLMPSRYCPSDELQNFVAAEFGSLNGGARIAQIRDWIFEGFKYVPGSSNAQTTALDTFVQRQGVCRDYAHVMIALARASAIPARFASSYAPYVTPQDFHAVAEVYLDGTWHLVDATGMAAANQIARIGVGADAAEVSFLSSFGQVYLQNQTVEVTVSE